MRMSGGKLTELRQRHVLNATITWVIDVHDTLLAISNQIITGVEPFGHLGERDVFHALYVRKQLPGDPMQVDDQNTGNSHDELIRVAELVLRCWNFDPRLRPDMLSVQDAIEIV